MPIIPDDWGNTAIRVVVIAAIIALVMLALRLFNIPIPSWVWTVGFVLLIAFVIIVAIKFLMKMGS